MSKTADNTLSLSDDRLMKSWLRGRAISTSTAYARDLRDFMGAVQKPLDQVSLEDVQNWFATLQGAEATRRRKLASIKSCFRFAAENRFIDFNVTSPVKPAKVQDDLHERIVDEDMILAMIAGEPDLRRRVVIRTLYTMGLRVSEACGLRWRDVARKKQGATASVFGKGGKTRHVHVTTSLWDDWASLRSGTSGDSPVLAGPDGRSLSAKTINRMVKRAAKRAGIEQDITAHWLRHACASHAQDNGAPPHVVQAMLGHASLATTTRYTHVREGEGTGNWLKG